MATLIIDIKTIAEPWESFDEVTKKSFLQWIPHTNKNKKEYEQELEKVKERLVFSPFTGQIVALGMYDVERRLGAVYYVDEEKNESFSEGDFTFKSRTEKELLEDFWEGARSYDVFVTFNGRAFDVPFLLHRSVVHGLKPHTTFNQSRYLTKQTFPYHVDLLDEVTFYGATKRPSLHLLCRAYGIESPKKEEGEEDAELFRLKKFRDLARNNALDIIATTELYEKWKTHLAPSAFLNAIEF